MPKPNFYTSLALSWTLLSTGCTLQIGTLEFEPDRKNGLEIRRLDYQPDCYATDGLSTRRRSVLKTYSAL